MEHNSNAIYTLLIRYIDGETTAEESLLMDEILQSDSYWKNEYNLLLNLNKHVSATSAYKINSMVDANFEILKSKIEHPADTRFKLLGPQVAKYTAAAILIFIAGWYFLNPSKNEFNTYTKGQTYKTGLNEIKTLRLKDGSIITLNQNSSLLLDKNYNSKNRLAALYGEAFFKVAKNTNKPFIVKTKQTYTKVLGTSFEIESKLNQRVILKLHEGKVQFITSNSNTVLTPNETITYSPSHNTFIIQKVKNLIKASWTSGLFFHNTKLKHITNQLEVLHNIKIKVPATLENEQYTVSLIGLGPEEILRLLSDLTDCRLIKKGTDYVLIP